MSAHSGTGCSASQAVKGGEGLDLAELLVQIGRGHLASYVSRDALSLLADQYDDQNGG